VLEGGLQVINSEPKRNGAGIFLMGFFHEVEAKIDGSDLKTEVILIFPVGFGQHKTFLIESCQCFDIC